MKKTLLASSLLLALGIAPAMAQERAQNQTTMNSQNTSQHDNASHRSADHRQNRMNDNDSNHPDAWLHTKVNAKFMGSSTVSFREIDVDVDDGAVHLRGMVGTQAEKQEAIRLARETEGVTRVNADDLRVGMDNNRRGDNNNAQRSDRMDRDGHDTADRPDVWLHTKVNAKLVGSSNVSFRDIDVDVDNGVVMLNGTVGTQAEKQEAIRLARETEGVRSVNSNNLRVGAEGSSRNDRANRNDRMDRNDRHANTAAHNRNDRDHNETAERPDAWVHTKVNAKFMGSSTVSFRDIDVDVDNGVTRLSGTVGTEAEKQEAIRLARETEGVRSVNSNNLRVVPENNRNNDRMNRSDRMDRNDRNP